MQKSRLVLAMLVAACSLALYFSTIRAAAYTLEIADSQQYYAPGSAFSGTANIRFETIPPQDAKLEASVDGSNTYSIYVQPYASGSYNYRSYPFSYNIVANGNNEWYEYPERQFLYRIEAEGTCGNDDCAFSGTCDCSGLCTPPYCSWNIVYDNQGSVSVDDGLSFILNASMIIAPPTSANPDIKWSELLNSPASQEGVQTTMRIVCGNSYYMGHLTDKNGWVKVPLQDSEAIPGTAWRKFTVDPFDLASLTTDRQKFISANCSQPYVCGGIYMDSALLKAGKDYTANGTTGEVIVKNYSLSSVYTMVYLPPNGPSLCAYTNYKAANSTAWTKKIQQSGSVSYISPFSRTYTQNQLPSAFNDSNRGFVSPPSCPDYADVCTQTVASYSASVANDPTEGSIKVSFDSQSRTVTGTLLSPEVGSRLIMINLSDFTGLAAPASPGEHTLTISLKSAGLELAKDEAVFYGCEDKDGDGYCVQNGDCNDDPANDPAVCKQGTIGCSQMQYSVCAKCIHPGAAELCDGIDNNCDGQTDETFKEAGSSLGSECGVGACKGNWICSLDKKNVTCSSRIKPGQQPEICGNGIDDDCDGVVDELYEMGPKGVPVIGCFCKDGDRKPCGSNVGACSSGYQICIKGDWSKCLDAAGPSEEICNGKDDNCNGIIDDVNGGSSIAATGCGCYGGAAPSPETCDGIDNDCNGLTDDGMKCCTQGSVRKCGVDEGFCKSGVQVCNSEGNWETECRGEVRPSDGNCNDRAWACQNGKKDIGEEGVDCGGMCSNPCSLPYNWILIAGGVALILVAVIFLRKKGK